MRFLLYLFLFIFLLHSSPGYPQEYSFSIKSLSLEQFDEEHPVTVDLALTLENNHKPNINEIYQTTINFLINYPSKTAYWEAVNKAMLVFLAQEYPFLTKLESRLTILPKVGKPHLRWSQAEMSSIYQCKEAFSFKLAIGEKHLTIHYCFNPSIGMDEYPDFLMIKRDVLSLLDHPLLKTPDSLLFIAHHLLSKYSMIEAVDLKCEQYLQDGSSYALTQSLTRQEALQ